MRDFFCQQRHWRVSQAEPCGQKVKQGRPPICRSHVLEKGNSSAFNQFLFVLGQSLLPAGAKFQEWYDTMRVQILAGVCIGMPPVALQG